MKVLLVVVLRERKPLFYEVGRCRKIKGGRRRRIHHQAEGCLVRALKIDSAFEAFRHFRISADAPRYQRQQHLDGSQRRFPWTLEYVRGLPYRRFQNHWREKIRILGGAPGGREGARNGPKFRKINAA